jgi:thioredoxin-like negative regulator of GroEL
VKNRARIAAALGLLWLSAACQPPQHAPQQAPGAAASANAIPLDATPAEAASAAPQAASEPAPRPARTVTKLRLIDDDIAAARKLAQAESKVLFVEVWAPWCHTCLSMKHYVLPSPAVVALQSRAVFAAVDSDRDVNAAFLRRYDVAVWPTLFVLEPVAGKVLGMWQGAASSAEVRQLVNDGADARSAALDPQGPFAALVQAKQAQAKRDFSLARQWYRKALARGGTGWPRRSEALYGEFFCFYRQGMHAACVRQAKQILPQLTGAARPGDTAAIGLSCAAKLADKRLRKDLATTVVDRLSKDVKQPPPGCSIDDRSDAAATLAKAQSLLGRKRAARKTTEFQLQLLVAAATAAGSPKQAAVFDYARMGALLRLGRWPAAEALLLRRVKQLPDAYEPRARLAQVYRQVGRHADALQAIQGAIERAYGPRRIGYLQQQIALLRALSQTSEERRAIRVTVAAIEALPKAALPQGAKRERLLAALRGRLKQLTPR